MSDADVSHDSATNGGKVVSSDSATNGGEEGVTKEKLPFVTASFIARKINKQDGQWSDRFYKDKQFVPYKEIQKRLNVHKQEIATFEKKIKDTTEKLEQKTRELDNANKQLKKKTEEIAIQNTNSETNMEECVRVFQEKQQIIKQIENLNQTIASLNDEKEQNNKKINEFVQQLNEGQQKQVEVQEQLQTATTNLNTQIQEKKKLLKQIETLTVELNVLREHGNVSESNKIQLQQTMEELATCNSNGQKHIEEIKTLQKQLTEAKQQIEDINQQNFEEQIANLKMALENDKKDKAKAEQDFQTQIAKLTLGAKQAQEVAEIKANEEFEKKINELKESSKNEAEQEFLQKLKALKIDTETAKRENKLKAEEEFKKQIDELKRINEELNIRLTNEKTMTDQNNNFHDAEVQGLKASIEQYKVRANKADEFERQKLEEKDREIKKLKETLGKIPLNCFPAMTKNALNKDNQQKKNTDQV